MSCTAHTGHPGDRRSRLRWLTRGLFFALFVFAPLLDIFRFDLTLGYFIVFGHSWSIGLDALRAGTLDATHVAFNLMVFGFLPIALVVFAFVWAAWRYGRLYCGWLCPHFSVVDIINSLMQRASGKPTLWEKRPLPEQLPDGRRITPQRRYWPLTVLSAVLLAFVWAISLLSYLLPPQRLWGHLFGFHLAWNEALFLGVGTAVFTLEFLFARHLFCRFGCAVGLFQSLAWMANRRALVVSFDRGRAAACGDCNNACDNACPMRLQPRSIKRRMFTFTQCSVCIDACEQVQGEAPPLLRWVSGAEARADSQREPGGNAKQPFQVTLWKNTSANSGTV